MPDLLLLTVTAAGLFLLGYCTGRYRPVQRVRQHVWGRVVWDFHGGVGTSKVVAYCWVALWWVMFPIAARRLARLRATGKGEKPRLRVVSTGEATYLAKDRQVHL